MQKTPVNTTLIGLQILQTDKNMLKFKATKNNFLNIFGFGAHV